MNIPTVRIRFGCAARWSAAVAGLFTAAFGASGQDVPACSPEPLVAVVAPERSDPAGILFSGDRLVAAFTASTGPDEWRLHRPGFTAAVGRARIGADSVTVEFSDRTLVRCAEHPLRAELRTAAPGDPVAARWRAAQAIAALRARALDDPRQASADIDRLDVELDPRRGSADAAALAIERARLLLADGQSARLRPIAESAAAERRSLHGDDRLVRELALLSARALQVSGRYAESAAALDTLRPDAVTGERHDPGFTIAWNLAWEFVALSTGAFDAAREAVARARRVALEAGSTDWIQGAYVDCRLAEYGSAGGLDVRALAAAAHRRLADTGPALLSGYCAYAGSLASSRIGEFGDALAQALAGQQILASRAQPSHHWRIDATVQLAWIYARFGRHSEALRLLGPVRSVEIAQRGPQSPGTRAIDVEITKSLVGRGSLEGAAAHAAAALAQVPEALRSNPDTLVLQALHGRSLAGLGDRRGAVLLDETVRRALSRPGGDAVQGDVFRVWYARAELRSGNARAAEAALAESIAWRSRHYGPDHPYTLRAQADLAAVALIDPVTAGGARRRLASIVERLDALRDDGALSPLNRIMLFPEFTPHYHALIDARLAAGETAAAFALTERLKGHALLEALAHRSAAAAVLPAPDALRLESLQARVAATEAALAGARADPVANARLESERDRLWQEQRALRAEFAELHPRYRALSRVRPPAVDEIARALPRDGAYIAFHVAEASLIAFVVTPDARLSVHRYPGWSRLEPALEAWRDLLRAPLDGPNVSRPWWRLPDGRHVHGLLRPDPRAAAVRDERALAAVLGDALLGPLLPRLRQATRWRLALDGPLAALPFDALVTGGRRVVELVEVDLSASASVWAGVEVPVPVRGPAARGLLAFGAPAPGECVPQAVAGADLRAAGSESTRAAALFPGSETYLGACATKASLLALNRSGRLRDFGVVLIASHGDLDPEAPLFSRLAFAPGRDAEDSAGTLTAAELAILDLRGALVVLSACETGTGRVLRGEGIVGLPFATLVAGARAAALTLWRVPDRESEPFVIDALSRVRAGAAPVRAFALAKRRALADPLRAHPAYWAGYQVHTGHPGALRRRR